MSHRRFCLATFLFASALSTGCTPTAATSPVKRPVPEQATIDRVVVRAKLAARRDQVVARFLAYRDGRVYPINSLPGGGFRHVWIDGFGNLCAAATLISGDWGRDATARVGEDDVEIRLADVKDGPLLDWMLTSGLTHHELVAIQVPGFEIEMPIQPDDGIRDREITRLYQLYIDVERQLRSMWDESLDDAVDALMRHPDLARRLIRDQLAGPGPDHIA